jgi:hypothetical protein
MLRIQKKEEVFYPGIDTNIDALGIETEFSLEIRNALDDSIIDNSIPNATFKEIMNSYILHTAEVLEDTNSGRKTFKVQNSNLEIGDKIKVNNNYYSVLKISSDGATITIKGTLKNSLNAGDSIETVGNTGIYKIPVQIDEPGFYFVTIFHKSFGYGAIKYKIVNSNVQDVMSELSDIKNILTQKGFI